LTGITSIYSIYKLN